MSIREGNTYLHLIIIPLITRFTGDKAHLYFNFFYNNAGRRKATPYNELATYVSHAPLECSKYSNYSVFTLLVYHLFVRSSANKIFNQAVDS